MRRQFDVMKIHTSIKQEFTKIRHAYGDGYGSNLIVTGEQLVKKDRDRLAEE